MGTLWLLRLPTIVINRQLSYINISIGYYYILAELVKQHIITE